MTDHTVQLLVVAAALTANFAVAGTALANEPKLVPAAAPSILMTGAALAPHLLPSPLPPAPATEPTPLAADVERLLEEPSPATDCAKACDEQKNKGAKLADDLLNELGTLPLIGTVMAPVTRGVMIPTGEGAPPLELAVKPTKITRGSGLVAIARF